MYITDFIIHYFILIQNSSLYCPLLERWIPVLMTIILREDSTHYKEHFKYLFQWIDEYCEAETKNHDNFYAQVIDFSMAERRGFIDAYVEYKLEKFNTSSYSEALLNSHKTHLEEEAFTFLKGCQEHYRQSITRSARNHAIVKPEDSAKFQSMTLNLLKTDISEFFEQVELCKKNWPNAITWLEWWVYTDAGKILFPALSTMSEDLSRKLPNSTNAQESMHSRYYLCGTTNQSIITGI